MSNQTIKSKLICLITQSIAVHCIIFAFLIVVLLDTEPKIRASENLALQIFATITAIITMIQPILQIIQLYIIISLPEINSVDDLHQSDNESISVYSTPTS